MESELIISIQRLCSSPLARMFVGFCARWLIYGYLGFGLLARRFSAIRAGASEAVWSALIALALSSGLAAFIGRVRPYLSGQGIEAFVPPNAQDGSFPSSHTAIAVAVAASLTYAHVPSGIVACIMVVLIAFGRIAAGMHYPTDIFGGVAVGLFAFLIVRFVQQHS